MYKLDWQRLKSILAATPGVLAAWVFGSAQAGQVRPGEDEMGQLQKALGYASAKETD